MDYKSDILAMGDFEEAGDDLAFDCHSAVFEIGEGDFDESVDFSRGGYVGGSVIFSVSGVGFGNET